MNSLISVVNSLKSSPIRKTVDTRLKEFENIPRDFNSLFRELAFCILTAGTSAELGLRTISHLGDTLFTGSQKDIQKKLEEIYRFHTIRAGYLYEARNSFKKINIHDKDVRNHLVKNIKGLGMKEASHFLRNVGFNNYAIIDFHIVDVLVKNDLIEKPKSKSLTSKKYLEIEEVLRKLAKETKTNLGELDLYLWYHETGKILK
ncbi:MAG: N-glycosylase/DNA lyase [Nanoarchaeota archaeon]